MRIMFSAVGAYGHLIPLFPLAIAARDAGHEVTLATAGQFAPLLAQAGLGHAEAGGTVREAIDRARAQHPDAGDRVAAVAFGDLLARRAAADLGPVIERAKPDLVVYEVLSPGGAIAAAQAAIPAVCHGIGRVSAGAQWRAMCEQWSRTAADLGVAVPEGDPQFLGNRFVDVCPPALQSPHYIAPALSLPMQPRQWHQPAPLPAITQVPDRTRPLVYLTFGTAFARVDLLRRAIDGLARLPVDVLVAAGPIAERAAIGEVPANVVLESWVPQGDVLAHVDLVVSHGGSGTTLGALADAVPHLVLPQGADQFDNARAVAEAGVGRMIRPAHQSAEAIADEAWMLLGSSDIRDRALGIAAQIAVMPSPAQVVEQLAAL